MENRLNVGITHGDVNGISYELIIKLLAENRICELCVPILYGSPKVAAYYRKVLNIENFSLNTIREPGEANGKRSNIINCVDDNVKVCLLYTSAFSAGVRSGFFSSSVYCATNAFFAS